MDDNELLQEAFEDAVLSRKAMEDSPSPKTREDWAVARGVFRMQVVKQQTGNLNALRAEYFALAGALTKVWQEMAVVDGWLRREGLQSPLPKDFIKSVRLPAISDAAKDFQCGTEAGETHFDFENVYSRNARLIWDDNFWYRVEYATEQD